MLADCCSGLENFDIRKFPQDARSRLRRAAGGQENLPVSLERQRQQTGARWWSRVCRRFGNSFSAIFPERDAEFFHRANPALRIARRANQRAEFHQRLVQVRARISVGRGVRTVPRRASADCARPTSSSASFQSRALVFFSFGFSAMPKMRVSTRMTLPSRIGVGWLKAMLQIAPAV